MCLRFPTSKNKVEHACEEFKDLSDHPQQVSAVLRPSSSRFDGARLLLSQVSAAARGTHSHHTTLINNSYPPPFGLGIVPTTPMDGSSPSTISRGTSPTSHKPHPAFPCGAELACPSHSRVPRPGGKWNHGTFRNHANRLYTGARCMRNRKVPRGSVSICIRKVWFHLYTMEPSVSTYHPDCNTHATHSHRQGSNTLYRNTPTQSNRKRDHQKNARRWIHGPPQHHTVH